MPSRKVHCANCGTGFAAYPSQVRNGKRFCSRSCALTVRSAKARVLVGCEVCGVQFETLGSLRDMGSGRFCSHQCRAENQTMHATSPERVTERFWAKVNKCGPVPSHVPEIGACWVWEGTMLSSGYGIFFLGSHKFGRSSARAHRYAMLLHLGREPDGFVCHKCDNRACVRPDHLYCGTVADNSADMARKGRARSSLSPVAVREIRSSGSSAQQLAERFGVTRSTIYGIRSGRTRKHVV